ncbi:hypothetical protein Q5P01_000813 [Channa striata]|uniref:Uncharacterized protein n=1 Tax=Channa striata TaxID=64152 RepID=A0AA88ISA2_CHASR|nr:hypothetical protein Q5P01_000813 [Channa striata]
MQQMGLYEQFPSDTPILVEFKKYLVEHLEVPNCQQEVDNVSRMLRYMQPTGDLVNMDFLKKSMETKDYIVSLKRAKLLPATILNYIKNMIRFVQFLLTRDVDDQDFHIGCQAYITLLNTLRKPVSKAHSKVTSMTVCVEGQKTISECQRLLRNAKKDMLGIFGNLQEEKIVSAEEKTLFRYYCEAILILGHFQRPGAVEGMTVPG